MFIIGLTGGIATGKSTVSAIFKELGAPVIDADIIARQVVEPGKPAWKKIRAEFPTVIQDDGTIDRAALGQIIFNDPSKRRILDKITHPYIHRTMIWEIIKCFFTLKQFVILDLPLLFESGTMVDYISKIVVVYADEDQQVERLMERNQYTKDHAQKRVRAQLPIEEKCNKAHFVINNAGTRDETKVQVFAAYEMIKKMNTHWKVRLYLLGWMSCLFGTILWFYFNMPARVPSLTQPDPPVTTPAPAIVENIKQQAQEQATNILENLTDAMDQDL